MLYPYAAQMVKLLDHMGDDDAVAYDARTSTTHERHRQEKERNDKLVRYLGRENHWTPFGQQQVKLRIQAPIFIARQLFRHNIGTVRNEMSRRYVSAPPKVFSFRRWRLKPTKGIKQGSAGQAGPVRSWLADALFWATTQLALWSYSRLIARGIAPEQARAVLPQATETIWVETGSLAYWARVYQQRTEKGVQVEARAYAEAIGRIMEGLFPVAWAALTAKADRVAELERELDALRLKVSQMTPTT